MRLVRFAVVAATLFFASPVACDGDKPAGEQFQFRARQKIVCGALVVCDSAEDGREKSALGKRALLHTHTVEFKAHAVMNFVVLEGDVILVDRIPLLYAQLLWPRSCLSSKQLGSLQALQHR